MKKILIPCLLLLSACSPSLQSVNNKVNAYRYIPEAKGLDEWKSPAQFYADGGGDCDDFAIVKMALLPDHETYIVIGYLPDGTPHAVLLVDGIYVLTNDFKTGGSTRIRHWSSYMQTFTVKYYSTGGKYPNNS
jgi:predicted transglutaminase-like cysteine proteinase